MTRKKKYEEEQILKKKEVAEDKLHEFAFNLPKDPGTKIITESGQEEVQQIRKRKKLDFGDKKKQEPEEIPQELIRVADDITIANYDVDFEEEGPELRMLGGIRGIKALRV